MKFIGKALAFALSAVISCVTIASVNTQSTQATLYRRNALQLKINKNSITLGKDENFTLLADQDVSWSSSAPKTIAVDKNGRTKAVGTGTAQITAKSKNGIERSCRITVKESPKTVRLSKTAITVGVGERYELTSIVPDGTAAAVRTFRTSDSSIVKMTKTNWTGKFKAVKEGTAWVTVKLYNGKEASCKVTVKKAPKAVRIKTAAITLGVGENYELNSIIPDGTAAASRTFRTSNSGIVKMTKTSWTGKFKAVKEGTAWVTVKLYNGKEASCRITVKKAPARVVTDRCYIELNVGDKSVIKAVFPEGSGCLDKHFYTDKKNILKMKVNDNECEITALSEGTENVRVKTYNGMTSYCRVVVKKEPDIKVINGVTYVKGVLVANKTYSLPSWYGNGLQPEALEAFNRMSADAANEGIQLYIVSGFRSYELQSSIYSNSCYKNGQKVADRSSARPGHSEHQTGLAMDINSVSYYFAFSPEAKWLAKNCHKYGFIIRYPEGKEDITGYMYESWHIRYLGKELAGKLYSSGQTLEEYLGITSRYSD